MVAVQGYPWYIGFLYMGGVMAGVLLAYAFVYILDIFAWIIGLR